MKVHRYESFTNKQLEKQIDRWVPFQTIFLLLR